MHLYQISSLLNSCTERLKTLYQSPEEATRVASLLIELVTGYTHIQLLIKANELLSEQDYYKVIQLVDDHLVHEKPLAYIVGQIPFLDLTIQTRPPILIPRPETEAWCADLIMQLHQTKPIENLRILDLCTGSGCIGLALAKAFPTSRVVGVDIAQEALDLAQENAQLNDINNITWVQSDLFANIDKQSFDLILANPPYIDHTASLPDSVQAWEDPRALFAPDSGSACIRKILDRAPALLSTKLYRRIPRLWIEIGFDQAKLATIPCNLTLTCSKDIFGQPRIITGT